MYDLSGLGSGQTLKVINDWKYLVDTMHVPKNPSDQQVICSTKASPLWRYGA